MKQIIYIGSREFAVEGQIKFTHCLIGQRDKAHFSPSAELLTKAGSFSLDPALAEKLTLSPEEYAKIAEFRQREIRGDFELCALAWAESEAEAEALKAKFPAPEWVNLRVVPVAATFP